MKDTNKTKVRLISELEELRQRVDELEESAVSDEQAKEALQALQIQYRTTLDSLGDPIHVVDTNLRIILFNRAFEQWNNELGLQSDVIGKNIFEVFRFLPESVREEYHRVFESGRILVTEESTQVGSREIITQTRKIPIYVNGRVSRIATVIRDITENLRAEEKLRESEARFRETLDLLPTVVVEFDTKGVATYVNKCAYEMLGYNPADMDLKKGFRITQLLSPEEQEKHADRLSILVEGGKVPPVEYRLLRKDGSIMHALVTSSPIHEDGKLVGIRSTATDITKRKLAEDALKESEEKYRLVVENANEGIIVTQDGKLMYANPITSDYTGYTVDELTSRPFVDFVHPDDREMVMGHHLSRLKGEKAPETYLFRVINKNGEIKWIEINGVMVSWEDRPATLNFLRDITERKRIEEELYRSEKRYELASRAGRVGVWDWNLETDEIYVDPNLKTMLGYEDHEIQNHLDDWGKHVHPDDAEQVMIEAMAHIDGVKRQYEATHRMLHKDGSARWFLARGTAIRDANGKPYRVVGTDTDITERKRMEEELCKSEAKLKAQATDLKEVNAALKVLLKRREEDKIELAESVQANVKELVFPYLGKLKKTQLNPRQVTLIRIVEAHLKDIVSSFTTKLSSRFLKLTPTEIKLANLIKDGRSTKEAAELLGLSENTIQVHRHHIRSKLGLKHKRINLRSYLRSLD